MNYKEIPTDSLYKFFTVAGAFLLIFSFTYYGNKIKEGVIAKEKYIQDLKISTNKYKELDVKFKQQERKIKDAETIKKKIDQTFSEMIKIDKINNPSKYSIIDKKYAELKKESEKAKMKLNEAENINDTIYIFLNRMEEEKIKSEYIWAIIKINDEELKYLKIINQISYYLGFLLLIIGLVKWVILQDIQDKILNYQLLIIEKENPGLVKEKKNTNRKHKKTN